MKLRLFLLTICGALHLARGEVVDPTTLRGKTPITADLPIQP